MSTQEVPIHKLPITFAGKLIICYVIGRCKVESEIDMRAQNKRIYM